MQDMHLHGIVLS